MEVVLGRNPEWRALDKHLRSEEIQGLWFLEEPRLTYSWKNSLGSIRACYENRPQDQPTSCCSPNFSGIQRGRRGEQVLDNQSEHLFNSE